jgi:alpha-L-fucosidase 2
MKNRLLTILVLFLIISCKQDKSSDFKIFYDKPAKDWMTEALPLGNGYIGAMYFGGVEKEQIQFSEGTLWSGGPKSNPDYNYGIRKGAFKHLAKARKLLMSGKLEEADKLVDEHFTGEMDTQKKKYNSRYGDYGAQQTTGDLFIYPQHKLKEFTNYRSELNISKSVATIKYEIGSDKFERTYFANYPKNVLVYRYESSIPTSYKIEFKTPHKIIYTEIDEKIIAFEGAVRDNNMKFETVLDFSLSDGELVLTENSIEIKNATDLIIKHVAATEFTYEMPNYDGNDYKAQNRNNLKKASVSYDELLNNHVEDYTKLFNRFSVSLGEDKYVNETTDKRLKAYSNGREDQYFESLFLQYNRYLMISGSRPNTMSMHLQGKWNKDIDPVWSADYHSNINLQMIYWPAELTNLSECHLPYLEYTKSLVEPGKMAAKEFFNARGWMVNTMCNAFGYTSIGWGLPWGYYPGGAAWMCQHLWDHYDFNLDKEFLKNEAYPIMKEAVLFWVDYLIKDENGKYVSCPSYSPEHGTISAGASMDQQIVWDLFNNFLKASKVLGVEGDFVSQVANMKSNLLGPKIGKWGQLQEWKEDVDDPKTTHRHVSHLFAVHPGNQISKITTPEFAKAAEVSLNARGDAGTGWSRAWKVNFWARLKDGERAHRLLKLLLSSNTEKSLKYHGRTYKNMFCTHPPFQLDGNMGGCSGMIEMLLQSQAGYVDIFPAKPKSWDKGSIKGVKSRGGLTLNFDWVNHKLTNLEIISLVDKKVKINYLNKKQEVQLRKGKNLIDISLWN